MWVFRVDEPRLGRIRIREWRRRARHTLGLLLLIPEVMGYTKIAGTPTVTGLYTILLPLVAFAFFGASRQLVVAADSATAAILAGMLSAVAAVGSKEYVGLTSTVALVVALMPVIARVFRLGFLADFLARSARSGFLTGVGVQLGGDAHLANFGLFASPERRILFGPNDFDETLPGPFDWDVRRLADSFPPGALS
ncbi:Sulfate permease and related transporter (MFS superfamily)-like protein [Burkholderia sp. H160]|nr:Sulfate permease and related transporter (MFS superfamily)-like protein [Burkholderia sp. H160]